MKTPDQIKLRAATLARAIYQAQHELELQARETLEELAQLRDELQAISGPPTHKIGAELGVEPARAAVINAEVVAESVPVPAQPAALAIREAEQLVRQVAERGDARLLLSLVDGCAACTPATTVRVAVPCRRCRTSATIAVQR